MTFLNIGEMLIGNLFVTLAALNLLRLFRFGIAFLDTTIFIFLWIYFATFLTFLLGLAGLLSPHTSALICLVGIVFILYLERSRLSSLPSIFEKLHEAIRSYRFRQVDALLIFFIGIELARIVFQIIIIPPYIWDTLTYHLPNVAEWIQHGRIFTINAAIARTNWPMTYEVFETWFALFPHHDALIQLSGVWSMALAFSCIYALARSLGYSPRLSLFAAVIFAYTPADSFQVTSCENDLMVAALYLFCLALIVYFHRQAPNIEKRGNQLFLLVMAVLFGVGTKPVMAFILPGLIFYYFFSGRISDNSGPGNPPWWHIARRRPATTSIVLLSGALMGLYWYLRNWVVFANPFHPVDVSLFGHLIFGTGHATELYGYTQQGHFSLTGLWENLSNLFQDFIFDHRFMTAEAEGVTNWGWFSFVCGLPALIFTLSRRRGMGMLVACFLISLLCLLSFVLPDKWCMRFALWFPALFALAFIDLFQSFGKTCWRFPTAIMAGFCLLLNFCAVLNSGLLTVGDFRSLSRTPWLERSVTAFDPEGYFRAILKDGTYARALRLLPKTEPFAYSVADNSLIYPLYAPDFSRKPVYIRLEPREGDHFIYEMKNRNLRILYVWDMDRERMNLLQWMVRTDKLVEVDDPPLPATLRKDSNEYPRIFRSTSSTFWK